MPLGITFHSYISFISHSKEICDQYPQHNEHCSAKCLCECFISNCKLLIVEQAGLKEPSSEFQVKTIGVVTLNTPLSCKSFGLYSMTKTGLEGGGHTGLWNIGMWHFNPNRSFQSQMDPKLFNWIPKLIIVAWKTFQRFISCIWEIFLEKFERFSLKCSNFVNFWARKTFFFFKQVRI